MNLPNNLTISICTPRANDFKLSSHRLKNKKFLSVQDSHYSEHIYYVHGYLIIVVIELSPKISCLTESASDGFIRCDGHVANDDTYPGVGLENEGHHNSHFFNSKGVFVRHTQLQL